MTTTWMLQGLDIKHFSDPFIKTAAAAVLKLCRSRRNTFIRLVRFLCVRIKRCHVRVQQSATKDLTGGDTLTKPSPQCGSHHHDGINKKSNDDKSVKAI